MLGFITGYFIKMFYVNNPDYNLHPAYNAALSLEVLRENIADFNEIAGWFTSSDHRGGMDYCNACDCMDMHIQRCI